MGFFDRFTGKSTSPAGSPQSPAATPVTAPAATAPDQTPAQALAAGNVRPRLVEAREKLEAKEVPAALAIYEEVLATAGDRADVLVTISGDLGVNGHLREIVELIAPRYDATRHGPATGLNLLQAYLALRNADAAQHVLDILFGLKRPELENRLHGFSNAIAELMHAEKLSAESGPGGAAPADAPAEPPKINLVSISKPIWYYGLESLPNVLPAKGERLRRVAFAQLAMPGVPDLMDLARQPEEELGRFSRALPLWFAETFSFSPHYHAIAVVGTWGQPGTPAHYALFPTEWSTDNLRQLVDSTEGGLDYVFTGAVQRRAGDWELVLRVWEVKKFRERKQFTARWTPATADAELAKLHESLRTFMEWSPYPADAGLKYTAPSHPAAWLEVLAPSLTFFLGDKHILASDQLAVSPDRFESVAQHAASNEAASLAWFTLRARAERLNLFPAQIGEALVFPTPLVQQAKAALGH
ncbi:MAG: hypothetical protein IPN11_10305 [Opitutaceae bacterium]|nr:hypothetical protein [Opitutaceae bacterium]